MSEPAEELTPTIDISGVQAADIIVTRNDAAQSKVIQYGSCSSYSHAILALGSGMCIEAIGEGVQILQLSQALSFSTYGALYRHQSIDSNLGAWICHTATQQEGKPYDSLGAIRSGVSTGCRFTKITRPGIFIQLADEVAKLGKHDKSFFCSELIVYAYEEAGLDIIRGGSQMASPGAIAKSPYLKYIKDVATV